MVSRLGNLVALQKTSKMQDLEQDILFFYDYILFLRETQKEDCWLKYTGIYINAIKLLSDKNLDYGETPKKFNKKNFITNYIKLSKKFRLEDFKHNIFMLQEIKIRKNKWILL